MGGALVEPVESAHRVPCPPPPLDGRTRCPPTHRSFSARSSPTRWSVRRLQTEAGGVHVSIRSTELCATHAHPCARRTALATLSHARAAQKGLAPHRAQRAPTCKKAIASSGVGPAGAISSSAHPSWHAHVDTGKPRSVFHRGAPGDEPGNPGAVDLRGCGCLQHPLLHRLSQPPVPARRLGSAAQQRVVRLLLGTLRVPPSLCIGA